MDIGAAGNPVHHSFRMNDLYDPNYTGTGHQPQGFDLLMGLYSKFTVIASKITLECYNADATNANRIVLLPCKDAAAITSTEPRILMEQMNAKSIMLGPYNMGTRRSTMSYKMAPHKFLGVSHPLSDDSMQGNASATPTQQAFWHVYCIPQDSGDDTAPVHIQVTIDYVAVFTEVKPDTSLD